MASGAVDGAMDRLHEGMPLVAADAQALAFEVGQGALRGLEARAPQSSEALAHALERAGEGLVHGVARGLTLELQALGARLRRPAAWLAGGGALLSLTLLAALRRRA